MEKEFFTTEMLDYMKKQHLPAKYFLNFYGFWCDQLFKREKDSCTVLVGDLSTLSFAMFYKIIKEKLAKPIEEGWDISYDDFGAITITNKSTGVKNTIISEATLKSNYPLDKNLKYFIVEDILVNGTELDHLKEELADRLEQDKGAIESVVYRREGYLESTVPDVWYAESISSSSSISLLVALNQCINHLNMPHSLSNNSKLQQNVEQAEFDAILENLQDEQSLNIIKLDTEQFLGLNSYMLVEKKLNLVGNETMKCCVLQYNEKTKLLSFEPIVLSNNCSFKDIFLNLQKYLTVVPDEISKSTEATSSLPLDVLTAVASYSYGEYFLKKYLPTFKGQDDFYDLLSLSFGKKLRDAIINGNNYSNVQSEKTNVVTTTFDEDKKAERVKVKKLVKSLMIRCVSDAVYLQYKDEGADLSKAVSNYEQFAQLLEEIIACKAKITTTFTDRKYSQLLDISDLAIKLLSDTSIPYENEEDKQVLKVLARISKGYSEIIGY